MTSKSTLSPARKFIATARVLLDGIEQQMAGAPRGTDNTAVLSPLDVLVVEDGLKALRGTLDDYETTFPVIATTWRQSQADHLV